MLALLPNSPRVIPSHLADPARIGFLITPSASRRTHQDTLSRYAWAVDCEMYAVWKTGREFDVSRYFRFLESIRDYPGRCLFVVVPDYPGDSERTLENYELLAPRLREFGFPLAFAAQDGLIELPSELDYDCLFVGGTNAYRFSGNLYPVVQQAKAEGKWVHFGRANTRRGIEIAARLGADSFDGTKSAIDQKDLRGVLAWSEATSSQMRLL